MLEESDLAQARSAWRGEWNAMRARQVQSGAAKRARRTQRLRSQLAIGGSCLLVALGLGAFAWSRHLALPQVATTSRAPESPLVVPFKDGSRAILQDRDSRLQVHEKPGEVVAVLSRGAATFDVRSDASRTFLVQAGMVSISVVGTSFRVTRDGVGASVEVLRGVVLAQWSGGERRLVVGESGRFPPAPPPSPEPDAAPPTSSAAAAATASPTEPGDEWRNLARQGSYPTAYQSLRRLGPSSVRDEAGDLLLAADVGRLSGHPREAAGWLKRLLQAHAGDARAPAAAFTLGRVLSDELGELSAGADAFALAERLAPNGTLAEAALARAAEGAERAGDHARARSAAQRYIQRFPTGSRLARMRELSRDQ